MPSFQSARTVSFKAGEMFDLVADVERYPEFLPLCEALKIRRRSTLEDGREVLLADMTVGYKAIRETFTSRVTLDRARLTILVEYVDGPFSHMENRWTFKELNGTSEVGFFIDYQFKSRMLGMLMGAMFETAFRRFSDAFVERAGKIYGKGA
jgi:coenzyme Q-binding protein COQ10